jgi:hypothetical protein
MSPATKNKERVKWERKGKELRVQDTNKGDGNQETNWAKGGERETN